MEKKSFKNSSIPTSKTPNQFLSNLDERSRRARSRIILALDIDHRKETRSLLRDALEIVDATSDYLCAVKINFHLIIPLSLSEISELNDWVKSKGLSSIADIKLNDIDNTNRVATEYLWDAGFAGVIVNPFVGYEGGLDAVFSRARELGKGVITLGYMSHKGADEGYGLELKDGNRIFELMLERAKIWGADGVILGTTRTQYIESSRQILGREIRIICPGSGAQGGDPVKAIASGADYLIFGRTIVGSPDPLDSIKQVYRSLLPLS